jgi:histidyl-tRNA synthetase
MRQFHQTGIELLGIKDPLGDVEVIATGAEFLRRIGAWDRSQLEINTLGDTESRQNYRKVLVDYLCGHRERLSEDSINRLERNPLRILDSKDPGDQAIVADAPVYTDYLNEASRDFFAKVKSGLDALGIKYVVNPRLVRGLDYYSHTCFEVTCEELGAQKTILAGGRYDGLIPMMGGPETPGVGWASGIERCAMLLQETPSSRKPIALVPLGERAETAALKLAGELRRLDFAVDLGFSGSMKSRMKRANKIEAKVAVILGDNELDQNIATLKDLSSGEQSAISLDSIADALESYR